MKTQMGKVISLEIRIALPANVWILEDSKTSINKLKKSLKSISRVKEGEDLSKLKNILTVIDLIPQHDGSVTKITQSDNFVVLCVRFNDHTAANNFRVTTTGMVKITGIGFKFLTPTDEFFRRPKEPTTHNMKRALNNYDEEFYTIIEGNGGSITKCYLSKSSVIITWVLFSKAKNAQSFMLSIRDNLH